MSYGIELECPCCRERVRQTIRRHQGNDTTLCPACLKEDARSEMVIVSLLVHHEKPERSKTL